MMAAKFGLLLGLSLCLLPTFMLVDTIVPEPYMDEIFHIPQAQQYCDGNFHNWDPMITTFPGLYLFSLVYTGLLLPVARIIGVASLSGLCNPGILRSGNMVLLLVCSVLFLGIIQHLEPKKSEERSLVKAFVLSVYPLHWFFGFLYYTDVGSTTAVMAMYLAGLKRAYWISSLFAAVSILFRQTNVVWAIFVTCVGVLDTLKDSLSPEYKAQEEDSQSTRFRNEFLSRFPTHPYVLQRSSIRKRQAAQHAATDSSNVEISLQQKGLDRFEDQGITSEVVDLAKLAWIRKTQLLWSFGPLLLVIISFGAFVLYNGSIVVGAKEAHKVSPHFAQILYFGLVTAAAMAPVNFSPGFVFYFFSQFKRLQAWFFMLLGCTAAFFCIHYFSFAHPYLLADNRHYTFYLWKDVICAHWTVKYSLIPLYVYAWWSILHSVGKRAGKLWVLVLFMGIAGVLVPAPLVEFRYYTIPIFLIALHTHVPKNHEVLVNLVLVTAYTGVNLVVLYLFLYRPFTWAHEPEGIQRFLW